MADELKPDGFVNQKLIVLPADSMGKVTEHPLVAPLYITDIGYFPRARHHYRERAEGCATYIAIYCVDGQGWFSLNGGKTIPLPAHSLVILPPLIPHSYGADQDNPWSIYWMHITGEHASMYLNDSVLGRILPMTQSNGQKFIELFFECFGTLERGYQHSNMIYVSQTLGYLLGYLFVRPGVTTSRSLKYNAMIDSTIRFMLENMERNLSLLPLAAHVNLSKTRFVQLFKDQTGYSPMDYFVRLKIQRACQYLDLSDLSVKEVCAELGFSDPYYFSRVFRKIMNISPTQYRKRQKG